MFSVDMGIWVNELTIKMMNLGKNYFYIFILLLLALFFFHGIISSTKIMNNVHYINDVTFYSYNMKQTLKDYELPLWTPYYYSGRPLFAQPEYINLLLILLTGNIYLAMNFTAIVHLFLAGLGMYFLVSFVTNSRKAAFISALIYMFNGFMHTFVIPGNIMVIEGYSLVPFILLFAIKALKEKNFILNSVITGLIVALLIFVGGVIFLPYVLLLIIVYSVVYIIDKNISQRVLKLIIVGVLVLSVSLGVSAVKLLPGLEFVKLSNRGEGLPYQEYLGEPIKMKNFVFAYVTMLLKGEHISTAIGLAGFLLLIFSLHKLKNRTVLFSLTIVLISLLMSTESLLTKFFYYIPIFNQIRHVERSIFLFAFASSILVGFGFISLEFFTKNFKKIYKNFLFYLIILLIISELILMQRIPQSVTALKPNEIPILDYISKDVSMFRTMNLALSTLIGATGYNYYSQLGISEIKGGSGIWFNDYINYLAVSQNAPAKFWGILNNKYVIAKNNISIDGLSYVAKFDTCGNDCQISEPYGPYLFENKKYLPRYYIAPNSILVVGDNTVANQLIYALMLQNFEPTNAVLVEGTSIDNYNIDFLKKFSAIFLVKDSVTDESIDKLREYVRQGGIIVPDILNKKNSIISDDINNVLNKLKGGYTPLKVEEYSNNKVVLELNGEKGWLVASERFAHFPGWKSSINNKKIPILKADNAISAVHLEGEKGTLVFEYKPDSYKKGKLISLLAALTLVSYFGYFVYSKKRKKGVQNQA